MLYILITFTTAFVLGVIWTEYRQYRLTARYLHDLQAKAARPNHRKGA